MTDHPAQLFTDAEIEPVEVVRYRWDDLQTWGARCRKCRAWISQRDTADEARRSGLAALEGHRCAMPGELPDSF